MIQLVLLTWYKPKAFAVYKSEFLLTVIAGQKSLTLIGAVEALIPERR